MGAPPDVPIVEDDDQVNSARDIALKAAEERKGRLAELQRRQNELQSRKEKLRRELAGAAEGEGEEAEAGAKKKKKKKGGGAPTLSFDVED